MTDLYVSQGGITVGIDPPTPDLYASQGGVTVGIDPPYPDSYVSLGGIVVGIRNGPLVPSLTVTPGITTATLTGSAYVHLDGEPHLRTDWEVASDSGFVTVVWSENEVYAGAPEDPPVNTATGLSDLTSYWARIRYYASDGWSEWVVEQFDTSALSTCGFVGAISATDPSLTSIGKTSPNIWGNYSAVGNELDNLLVGIRYGDLHVPRAMVVNTCTLHDQVDIVGYASFDGEVARDYYSYYNFFWATNYGIEWSGMGLCALAKGTFGDPANPFSGIFATLVISTPAPNIFPCPTRGQTGTSSGNHVRLQIWEKDVVVKNTTSYFADNLNAISRSCIATGFTKYGMRLKVRKDLVGDPTGRTWTIKFDWKEDAIPDELSWAIEETHVSENLDCGYGGIVSHIVPGATLGASGAIVCRQLSISNFTEDCEPGDGSYSETDPEVTATSNCAGIYATGGGWSGVDVGPVTEAKWDVRLTSDSSLVYTTGWQSEFLSTFKLNLFDFPTIPPGTSVDIEVTFRDAELDTSNTSAPFSVTTGNYPNAPSVVVNELYQNLMVITTGPFSSTDLTALHYTTTIGLYLASDTELENPLSLTEFTTPEQLTGMYSVYYDFTVGESYIVQVVYTDIYGCSSSSSASAALGEAPPIISPDYDTCIVSVEGEWTVCQIGDEGVWTACQIGAEASWETD